jgi:hypothetical protein
MKLAYLIATGLGLLLATAAVAGPPAGALHTTDVNGEAVNANYYQRKTDVYVTGGPNSNAGPILDAGLYFFQVTDPAGKVLLSQSPLATRTFQVDATGRVVAVGGHATGIDQDDGDLTVQLFPFADTPNNGGVYKVWITPVQFYAPGLGSFGFLGKYSKTDTFKVLQPEPPTCGCGCSCGG